MIAPSRMTSCSCEEAEKVKHNSEPGLENISEATAKKFEEELLLKFQKLKPLFQRKGDKFTCSSPHSFSTEGKRQELKVEPEGECDGEEVDYSHDNSSTLDADTGSKFARFLELDLDADPDSDHCLDMLKIPEDEPFVAPETSKLEEESWKALSMPEGWLSPSKLRGRDSRGSSNVSSPLSPPPFIRPPESELVSRLLIATAKIEETSGVHVLRTRVTRSRRTPVVHVLKKNKA